MSESEHNRTPEEWQRIAEMLTDQMNAAARQGNVADFEKLAYSRESVIQKASGSTSPTKSGGCAIFIAAGLAGTIVTGLLFYGASKAAAAEQSHPEAAINKSTAESTSQIPTQHPIFDKFKVRPVDKSPFHHPTPRTLMK